MQQAGMIRAGQAVAVTDSRRLCASGVLLAWWALLMVAILLGPSLARRSMNQGTRWQAASPGAAATHETLTTQTTVCMVGQYRIRSLAE